MKNLGGNLGTSVFGIVSFALTVLVVVVIERLTTFNIFTLSFWFVIPAGALLVGFAAASGYYFGSLLFHTHPSWWLLLQIIIVAALAQFAIYFGEYRALVLDDGTQVADFVPFLEYLDIYLKSAHLRVGRGAHIDTGEVGSFGYWLAAIQFVGFIFGGVALFLMLRHYPTCEACGRYLRTLAKREQRFAEQEEFANHYDSLFRGPVDAPEFVELMQGYPNKGSVVTGTILSTYTLRGCPACKVQRISQEVKIRGKEDWSEIPTLSRHVRIPAGINLLRAFSRAD